MKTNRTRTITLAAALLLALGTLKAQVFILSEEEFDNSNRAKGHYGPLVPFQGSDQDQSLYTPVGGGIALLTALGGAYLLGKRRREGDL